ncbi:hypothetical protein ACOSQ3_020978 [Xanthoceras sorbifolium]
MLTGWSSCPLFSKLSKLKAVSFFDRILWLCSRVVMSWLSPPLEIFKLNVDASVFKSGFQVGAGSIVRRSDDNLVLAAASVFRGARGLFPLLIESYSLNIVNLYLGKSFFRNEIMNVIQDIQLLLVKFPSYAIAHVPISCNSITHEVAKKALLASISLVWEDYFPSWLANLAQVDVAL